MKSKADDEFIIDTNRKCYDNLGELYTDGEGDLETLMDMGAWRDFLDRLNGRKVLDVGCGAGDAAKWLVDNEYDVTACDLSEEMIKVARAKTAKAKFLTLGATELENLDEKFDGIISIHLVQHLSKTMLKKFFGDVYDLLADDGKFLLVFTNTCYKKTGYSWMARRKATISFGISGRWKILYLC